MAAGNAVREEEILLGPADGAAPVGADAERIGPADRGTQFEATADTGRRDALEQDGVRAVAPRRDAREAALEIAELDIAEREPLGCAHWVMDETHAGIDAVGLARREIDPAVAPVGEAADACFDPAAVARVEAQAKP